LAHPETFFLGDFMPPLPKTTAQHQAAGTYRADRHRLYPLRPTEVPSPPKWLTNKAAKKKWREVADLLAGTGVFTTLDLDALAAYCSAFVAWRTAADTVERDGQTYRSGDLLKAHPAVAIMQSAAKEMQTWADRLALTPASRQRMRVEPPPPKLAEDDPKARFFQKREQSLPA
jgi:P27 family predicted phage terminase small subunit